MFVGSRKAIIPQRIIATAVAITFFFSNISYANPDLSTLNAQSRLRSFDPGISISHFALRDLFLGMGGLVDGMSLDEVNESIGAMYELASGVTVGTPNVFGQNVAFVDFRPDRKNGTVTAKFTIARGAQQGKIFEMTYWDPAAEVPVEVKRSKHPFKASDLFEQGDHCVINRVEDPEERHVARAALLLAMIAKREAQRKIAGKRKPASSITSSHRASPSGEGGQQREKLLKSEPIDKEIHETVVDLHTKTMTILAKRKGTADRARKEELAEAMQAEIKIARKRIGNFSRITPRRTGIENELLAMRNEAYQHVKNAERVIGAMNEPAAMLALSAALDDIRRARTRALEHRKTIQGRIQRVRVQDDRIELMQTDHVLVGKARVPIGKYSRRRYKTLWKAFRALDDQRRTELDDHLFCRRAVRTVNNLIRDIDPERRRRGKAVDLRKELTETTRRLNPRRGDIYVEEKRLARIYVREAIELFEAGEREAVVRLLRNAAAQFSARIASIEGILRNLEDGHVKALRSIAKEWNDEIKNIAAGAAISLGRKWYGDVESKINELLAHRAVRTEPQYHGLKLLLTKTLQMFKEDPEDYAEAIEYDLKLLESKAAEANRLADFMIRFRTAWVRARKNQLIDSDSANIEKMVFEANFKSHMRGSQEKWWTRCYLPAFISTRARAPKGQSGTVDNPLFLAVNDLIVVQEVIHFGRLLEEYEERLPATSGVLADLIDEIQAQEPPSALRHANYDRLDDAQKYRLLKALADDYELTSRQRNTLYTEAVTPFSFSKPQDSYAKSAHRASPTSGGVISGVTGFIGSNLANTLHDEGAGVVGLARSGSKNLVRLSEGARGDIRDMDLLKPDLAALEDIMRSGKPFFHLGGMSNHQDCKNNPHRALTANAVSTAILAALARKHGTRFVFASTFYVYTLTRKPVGPRMSEEESRNVLLGDEPEIRELRAWLDSAESIVAEYVEEFVRSGGLIENPLDYVTRRIEIPQIADGRLAELGLPNDYFYPLTKHLAERLVARFGNRDNAVIVRFSNIYGPNQDTNYKVPCYIRGWYDGDRQVSLGIADLNQGDTFRVREGGRDFLYVADCVRALREAARIPVTEDSRVINIGSGFVTRNDDIGRAIASAIGVDITVENEAQKDRPVHICDNDRFERYLHPEPLTPLEDGIRETVAYYTRSSPTSENHQRKVEAWKRLVGDTDLWVGLDMFGVDFDGVIKDREKAQLEERFIRVIRSLIDSGVCHTLVTGEVFGEVDKRLGPRFDWSRLGLTEEDRSLFRLIMSTGAIGRTVTNDSETFRGIEGFEDAGLEGSEREIAQLLRRMSREYDLVEGTEEGQVDIQESPEGCTLELERLSDDEKQRVKDAITARVRFAIAEGEVPGAPESIEVVSSASAVDVVARSKGRALARAIALQSRRPESQNKKRIRVLMVVDSVGTQENPGNDRSMLELTEDQIKKWEPELRGWKIELIKVYVGTEPDQNVPDGVTIAPEPGVDATYQLYDAANTAKRRSPTSDNETRREEPVMFANEDARPFEEIFMEDTEWFSPEMLQPGLVIGVPKETKANEERVGLTPQGVAILKTFGVEKIVVETGAGLGAGFADEDYLAAGAEVVPRASDAWAAGLVIKVKEPLEPEYRFLRSDQVVFTYFHLASQEARGLTEALMTQRLGAAVAYETVTVGRATPLLEPMSKIAGILASYWSGFYSGKAAKVLGQKNASQRLVEQGLISITDVAIREAQDEISLTYPGSPPNDWLIDGKRVVVMGGGVVGINAALMYAHMGASVAITEANHTRRLELERIFARHGLNIEIIVPENTVKVKEALSEADAIVTGVYKKGGTAPELIGKKLLREISKGKNKIIVDVSIDQGGNVWGSRTTYYDDPVFVDEFGNIRFCVANMPALPARQASIALEEAKLKYALALACGLETAVSESVYPDLKGGINVLDGELASKEVADAHKLKVGSKAERFLEDGVRRSPTAELKKTPLHGWHKDNGARMHEFAGYDMPLWYTNVTEEHAAVRNAAGLFDISHMGAVELWGPNVHDFLQKITTNDISGLVPGKAQYSFLVNDMLGKYDDLEAGDVLDDVIIYRLQGDRYMLVVNAGNKVRVVKWLYEKLNDRGLVKANVQIDEGGVGYAPTRAMFAIQGPKAEEILKRIVGKNIWGMPPFSFEEAPIQGMWFEDSGHNVIISRTGYTGEQGFEIFVDAENALTIWNEIIDAGKGEGLVPCGLAARDSLRLEAGLPLHGHELAGPDHLSPYEFGFGRFVALDKGSFVGRDQMIERREHADRRVVTLLLTGAEEGKADIDIKNMRMPRHAEGNRPPSIVRAKVGGAWQDIGAITSQAVRIPTWNEPGFVENGALMAMAHVKKEHAVPGTEIQIRTGNSLCYAVVMPRGFYNNTRGQMQPREENKLKNFVDDWQAKRNSPSASVVETPGERQKECFLEPLDARIVEAAEAIIKSDAELFVPKSMFPNNSFSGMKGQYEDIFSGRLRVYNHIHELESMISAMPKPEKACVLVDGSAENLDALRDAIGKNTDLARARFISSEPVDVALLDPQERIEYLRRMVAILALAGAITKEEIGNESSGAYLLLRYYIDAHLPKGISVNDYLTNLVKKTGDPKDCISFVINAILSYKPAERYEIQKIDAATQVLWSA